MSTLQGPWEGSTALVRWMDASLEFSVLRLVAAWAS
jgi:hypothetical protein